jgi:hypothetical protein
MGLKCSLLIMELKGQRSSALVIEVEIWFLGSKMLPYYSYGLPMGGRCSLSNLGSKSQRSSALDIKVKIWFPGLECYPYHLETPYHTYGLPIEGRCSLLNLASKGQVHWLLKWKYAFRAQEWHHITGMNYPWDVSYYQAPSFYPVTTLYIDRI